MIALGLALALVVSGGASTDPGPVPLAVLAIDAPEKDLPRASELALRLRERLLRSKLFRAPGPEAVWVDPHYGYLGKCNEPDCAWRSTLLLNVRYAVVGRLSGTGSDLALDLDVVEGESGETRKIAVRGPYDSLVSVASQALAGNLVGLDLHRKIGTDTVADARSARMQLLSSRIRWADRGVLPLGIVGSLAILAGIGRAVDTSKGPAEGWNTTNVTTVAVGAGMVGLATWLYFRARSARVELQQEQDRLGSKVLSFAPTLAPHAWGVRLDAAF